MPLSAHDPWTDLLRRLAGGAAEGHPLRSHWTPDADVEEDAEGLRVVLMVPGVPAGRLRVQASARELVVEGERPPAARSPEGVRYHRLEVEYGPFRRAIALPFAVDGAGASARLADGVLTVRLPRCARPARRVVRIRMET